MKTIVNTQSQPVSVNLRNSIEGGWRSVVVAPKGSLAVDDEAVQGNRYADVLVKKGVIRVR